MPKFPSFTEDSFQSLGVMLQQGDVEDAIGTLAIILSHCDNERLIKVGEKLANGTHLKFPAN